MKAAHCVATHLLLIASGSKERSGKLKMFILLLIFKPTYRSFKIGGTSAALRQVILGFDIPSLEEKDSPYDCVLG